MPLICLFVPWGALQLAEIGTHGVCWAPAPLFASAEFVDLAVSVPPWVWTPGCFRELWMVLLPSFPSLGGEEKNLFSILFPLSANLSHHHPWLRISQWKGRKAPHLSTLIWRNGRRNWGLGDRLPQLSQPGGLVTTKASHLKPEKSKTTCLLSHFYCYEGDAGVVLAKLNNHRAFACVSIHVRK